MFEDILRELKRMELEPQKIPVKSDGDGYFDRECPNMECEFQFKVMLEDWGDFKGQEMHCPLCGKNAPADHYWTKEHLEQAKAQAMSRCSGQIGRALSRDAKRFNSRQPHKSFISMSMRFKGSTHVPLLFPIKAAEEMQLKITCEKCESRFAVIGSAFFCPKCGHSSAVKVFEDALTKVDAKVSHLDRIVNAVAEVDKDGAELTRRSLLESSISDAVVAFQRVMEELFKRYQGTTELPRNVFQRLHDGSELWKAACGLAYSDILGMEEHRRLGILFQRRHLLAHKEGIVDNQYVQRSSDTSYEPGQRIVVSPADITQLVVIVRRVVNAYMDKVKTHAD